MGRDSVPKCWRHRGNALLLIASAPRHSSSGTDPVEPRLPSNGLGLPAVERIRPFSCLKRDTLYPGLLPCRKQERSGLLASPFFPHCLRVDRSPLQARRPYEALSIYCGMMLFHWFCAQPEGARGGWCPCPQSHAGRPSEACPGAWAEDSGSVDRGEGAPRIPRQTKAATAATPTARLIPVFPHHEQSSKEATGAQAEASITIKSNEPNEATLTPARAIPSHLPTHDHTAPPLLNYLNMRTAALFLATLGLASAFMAPAPRMQRGRTVRMVCTLLRTRSCLQG